MGWSIYGNIGGDGTKDVIAPESLGAAQEHKIVIDIMKPNAYDGPALTTIEGFSKEAFSYSVQAEYSNVLGWSDSNDGIFAKMFKDATQRNLSFFSGYGSKRIFNPGKSYVQLNLKFRAYDEPDIISKCDLLTKCCLPIISRENFMLNTNAIEVAGAAIGRVGTYLGEGAFAFVNNDYSVGAVGASVLENITDDITSRMPPHLRISIGSYFKKTEMVLTNCSFTFSKEFTRSEGGTYPTYVDFDLQVESLYSSLALGFGTPESNSSEVQSQIFGPGFSRNNNYDRVVIDEYEKSNPVAGIGTQISNAWSNIKGSPKVEPKTP